MVKPLFFFSALTRRDKEADAIAKDAHGFVGADVAALVREAAMEALRRHVRRRRDGGDDEDATASATEKEKRFCKVFSQQKEKRFCD